MVDSAKAETVSGVLLLARMRVGFSAFVFVIMATAVYSAMGFHSVARYFPLSVGVAGVLFAGTSLVRDFRRMMSNPASLLAEMRTTGEIARSEEGSPKAMILRAAYYLLWLIGLIAAIWLVGMIVAIVVFLISFLIVEGHWRWWSATFGAMLMVAFVLGFTEVMTLRWPRAQFPLHTYIGL